MSSHSQVDALRRSVLFEPETSPANLSHGKARDSPCLWV